MLILNMFMEFTILLLWVDIVKWNDWLHLQALFLFNLSLQEHYGNYGKLQALPNTVTIDYVSGDLRLQMFASY